MWHWDWTYASHTLGKHFTTELHAQHIIFFNDRIDYLVTAGLRYFNIQRPSQDSIPVGSNIPLAKYWKKNSDVSTPWTDLVAVTWQPHRASQAWMIFTLPWSITTRIHGFPQCHPPTKLILQIQPSRKQIPHQQDTPRHGSAIIDHPGSSRIHQINRVTPKFSHSPREAEVSGSLWVWGQSGLQNIGCHNSLTSRVPHLKYTSLCCDSRKPMTLNRRKACWTCHIMSPNFMGLHQNHHGGTATVPALRLRWEDSESMTSTRDIFLLSGSKKS